MSHQVLAQKNNVFQVNSGQA